MSSSNHAAAVPAVAVIFLSSLARLAEGFAPPTTTAAALRGSVGASTALVTSRAESPCETAMPFRTRPRVGAWRSAEWPGSSNGRRARGWALRVRPEASASPRGTAAAGATGKRPAGGGVVGGKKDRALGKLQDNLKRFAGLRMWRQALTAFDKAKADGLPLDSFTYTQMINAMSKGGRWREATELLDEMVSGGNNHHGRDISPSVVSYNAAISACARGKRHELALDLLRSMRVRSGISPDRYSYAAAMSALAKAGKPAHALRLLEEMRQTGLEPDSVCFAAAMEACETRGAWREAGEILEQVRNSEPPPTPEVLTTILTRAISSCVPGGAWEQATDHLTDIRMANFGAVPPAASYAAAANACARAGQAVRAQALIADLAKSGGEDPTIECYNAVVAALAIAGEVDAAIRVLKEDVAGAGLKPDTRGFNHAIAGCARAGEWEKAMALLDEQRSGFFPTAPPDRGSYNAVLDACGRAGQVLPALALLDAMRSLSRSNKRLKPDRYSYGGALQACRAACDHSTALRLLSEMKGDGVRADQLCSLAAVAACAAAGRGHKAGDVLEGMVAARMSTSDGARALAREACAEAAALPGGGAGFERAIAALDLLDEAAAERAVAKAEKIAAEVAEVAVPSEAWVSSGRD